MRELFGFGYYYEGKNIEFVILLLCIKIRLILGNFIKLMLFFVELFV